MHITTIWASVGLLLLVCEFFVPGVFLMFFGLGALVVAALMLVCPFLSVAWQLVICGIVSIALLLLLRKRLAKTFVGRTIVSQDNLDDDFTGRTAVVTSDIEPGKAGKIELNGAEWKATADEAITSGETVAIVSRDGLTLLVRKTYSANRIG